MMLPVMTRRRLHLAALAIALSQPPHTPTFLWARQKRQRGRIRINKIKTLIIGEYSPKLEKSAQHLSLLINFLSAN